MKTLKEFLQETKQNTVIELNPVNDEQEISYRLQLLHDAGIDAHSGSNGIDIVVSVEDKQKAENILTKYLTKKQDLQESERDFISAMKGNKHLQIITDEAAKVIMQKNNLTKEQVLDGLKKGDKKLLDQFAKLIAVGLSAV